VSGGGSFHNTNMGTEALQAVSKCPHCSAESATGKKFCADCGAPLSPADSLQQIRAEVTNALSERLKDRHAAEVEIFESVLERLFKYAKWFSAAIALPVSLFLGGLAFFGWEKVHDINTLAARVDKEVKPKVDSALRDASSASASATQAKQTAEQVIRDINKQLVSAQQVTAKVEDLSAKVSKLEATTTEKVNTATTRIENQVKNVDQRVNDAQSQINEQQKKLTDTGELVKSIFANSRVETFSDAMVGRYLVREGNNRRVVFILLHDIPYPESVQLQWYVYTQPRNSYAVIKNVVIFFWGDPADNLKQHPLLVNYVADTSSHEQAFKELHVDKDVVFADGFPFGNVR
jgi:hypothetical protein